MRGLTTTHLRRVGVLYRDRCVSHQLEGYTIEYGDCGHAQGNQGKWIRIRVQHGARWTTTRTIAVHHCARGASGSFKGPRGAGVNHVASEQKEAELRGAYCALCAHGAQSLYNDGLRNPQLPPVQTAQTAPRKGGGGGLCSGPRRPPPRTTLARSSFLLFWHPWSHVRSQATARISEHSLTAAKVSSQEGYATFWHEAGVIYQERPTPQKEGGQCLLPTT